MGVVMMAFLPSAAKEDAAQFIAEALGFLRVGGVAETLGELEKLLLLALLGLIPSFNTLLSLHARTSSEEHQISWRFTYSFCR